ncbi:MAG: hypothetical protein MUF15_18750, partial [Acidobacteria bacterium]|nr:hypothetical protein [Acidobacteriota bacterium]
YFPFKRLKYNHFVVPKPLIITGPFDLVLNTRDITNSGRYAAPYAISAAVDNQEYFDLKFDRFQWDENNQLGFVYDMSYSNPSSFYYNLFYQEGFSLESKNKPFQDVINGLEYGEHQLKIRVKDIFENESIGEITFFKVKKPGMHLYSYNVENNQIDLGIQDFDAGQADAVTITLKNRDGRLIYSGQFKYTTVTQPKDFILKGSFSGVHFIDFNFIKNGLTYFKQRFLLKEDWLSSVSDIAFEPFCHRDDVFIRITNPIVSPQNLRLTVVQGAESQIVNAESANDTVYFRFTPLNFTNKVLLNFAIIKEGQEIVRIQKPLTLVYLKKGMNQNFKYEEFSAEFDTRAVYEPRTILIEEKDFPSGYPILSKQISLSPTYFTFLDAVRCIFKKDLPNPQQVGIFKYDPRYKGWGYKNTTYESASKTYRHTMLTPGVYALMRDIFPPRVFLRKIGAQHKGSLKRLDIGMSDSGKGINDNTLNVHLNGILLDVDYDPDWRAVYIENDNLKPLKIGKNVLEVEVRDHAGNKTARSFTFHLK